MDYILDNYSLSDEELALLEEEREERIAAEIDRVAYDKNAKYSDFFGGSVLDSILYAENFDADKFDSYFESVDRINRYLA